MIASTLPIRPFRPLRRPEDGLFRLRPPREGDVEAMSSVWSDPAVTAALPTTPLSKEDVWRRLLMYVGHWEVQGFGPLVIARVDPASADEPGVFVGETGFYRFRRGLGEDFDAADEMGWTLSVAHHGSGLAAAACHAALDWLAAVRPGRVVCMISDANAPSRALAGRLGFAPYRAVVYKTVSSTLYERTVGD